MRRLATPSLVLAALLASSCASAGPTYQRLLVESGDAEHVFETVAYVIGRRFPVAVRDLGSGIVESRYVEERRGTSFVRWKATGVVRPGKDGIVVAVTTVVEEFGDDGFFVLGSLEEIDERMLFEIEERLLAADVKGPVKMKRLDPAKTPRGDGEEDGEGGAASAAAPRARGS